MNTMIKKFFATDTQNWSLLVTRIALGIVMLPHGMQKVFGVFGGYGLSGTLGFFHSIGIPGFFGVLVILAEFVGSLGLIFGIGTRFMAFSIFAAQFGAIFLGGHYLNGFFMNWFGAQKGEGIEYFILTLGIALSLIIAGSGKFSFDNLISKYLKSK